MNEFDKLKKIEAKANLAFISTGLMLIALLAIFVYVILK